MYVVTTLNRVSDHAGRVIIGDDGAVAPVRVVVIEEQALFAKALCQMFAADPELLVVGDANAVETANLGRMRPDVIVLDLNGQTREFSATMARCREVAPQAKVCVLSTHPQAEIMQQCLADGAFGYIIKDISPAELIRAVKSVAEGHVYVDPRVAGRLLKARNASGRPALTELSSRETEIIRLLARGFANKEISGQLHLSEKTVKNHISRIFVKIGVTARTQAAVHAIKMGLA